MRGFDGVNSNGNSGGLALYWHETLSVDVVFSNERCIDAHIRAGPDEAPWRLTCVYGEPRVEDRHLMWSLMQDLCARSDVPWLVVGDFNECMWDFEHFSSTARAPVQMQSFRDVLETCALADLGFSGVPYTYDNKRSGNANVRVRLDRAVANPAWRNLFDQAFVRHLTSPCSDHVPVHVSSEVYIDRPIKPRIRQYEVMWEREPALQEVIARAWSEAGETNTLGDVHAALRGTMRKLCCWSKEKFGNVAKEIEKSRTQLEELMMMNADRCEIRKVTDKMNELLYREELMWMQRSRVTWLKDGDRNTQKIQSKSVWSVG